MTEVDASPSCKKISLASGTLGLFWYMYKTKLEIPGEIDSNLVVDLNS